MIDDQVWKHGFEPSDLPASVVDVCLVEFIVSHVEVFQFFHLAYSKASRYTALRSTDLGDTRFLISS